MRGRIAVVIVVLTWAGAVVNAQDIRDIVGPLEQTAKSITPENPIPRRSFSVAPHYPAEARAIEAVARVTLRATLDQSGRVAEIRKVNNPFVMVPPSTSVNPAALQAAGDAMVRSAAAALQVWQYDPPADSPISFNVTFGFRPDGEPTMSQSSVPPGRGPARLPGVPAGSTTPWEAAAGAVRVGGDVRAPARLRHVNPVYPVEARDARVQGVVILEAVIGPDGRVTDVRTLRSIPQLDQSAVDAVRQWEYSPTLLNGAPVPLVMTVTVQFTLR